MKRATSALRGDSPRESPVARPARKLELRGCPGTSESDGGGFGAGIFGWLEEP